MDNAANARSAKHSSASPSWGTPPDYIEAARRVLGGIDLDPASSDEFQATVGAGVFYTAEDDGLKQDWGEGLSILVNPPGGITPGDGAADARRRSLPMLFWEKLMRTPLGHAIWIAFSLEQLQVSQNCADVPGMLAFPFCVPRARMRFVKPGQAKNSPTHANAIIYVPGSTDNTEGFVREFSRFGTVVVPK